MLTVDLVTAQIQERIEGVAAVRCQTPGGPIKILPHHGPLLAILRPGNLYLIVARGGIETRRIPAEGLLKVFQNTLTIAA